MRRHQLIAALLVSVAAGITSASAAGSPTAVIAGGCSIPQGGEHLGPTYLTSLSVSGAGCATGLAVVRAYHNCQLRRGSVKATCNSSVAGFRCRERRGPSIPSEFYSSVSCTSGGKRVSYTYSQFT